MSYIFFINILSPRMTVYSFVNKRFISLSNKLLIVTRGLRAKNFCCIVLYILKLFIYLFTLKLFILVAIIFIDTKKRGNSLFMISSCCETFKAASYRISHVLEIQFLPYTLRKLFYRLA